MEWGRDLDHGFIYMRTANGLEVRAGSGWACELEFFSYYYWRWVSFNAQYFERTSGGLSE
jgi:hypothetical protein